METQLIYNLSGAIVFGLISMWILNLGIIGGILFAIAGWFLGGRLNGSY